MKYLRLKPYRSDGTPYYWWESSDEKLAGEIVIYLACLSGEMQIFLPSCRETVKAYLYYWLDCEKWQMEILPLHRTKAEELIASAYHPPQLQKAIAYLQRIGINPFRRNRGH